LTSLVLFIILNHEGRLQSSVVCDGRPGHRNKYETWGMRIGISTI